MPSRDEVSTGAFKTSITISVLAAVWLFISPWGYRDYLDHNAWNCWVVGFLIAVFALVHLSSPTGARFLSYCNMVLGAWTFASPWIYNYTADMGRFVNSLCVGVIVFIFAVTAATSSMQHLTTHGEPPGLRP